MGWAESGGAGPVAAAGSAGGVGGGWPIGATGGPATAVPDPATGATGASARAAPGPTALMAAATIHPTHTADRSGWSEVDTRRF